MPAVPRRKELSCRYAAGPGAYAVDAGSDAAVRVPLQPSGSVLHALCAADGSAAVIQPAERSLACLSSGDREGGAKRAGK